MFSRKKTAAFAAISTLLLASAPAFAGVPGTSYVGLSLGQTTYDYSASTCSQDFLGLQCSTSTSDTAVKLFGGVNINRNLAVEGTYYYLGKLTINVPQISGQIQSTSQAFDVNLIGSVEAAPGLNLMVRGGVFLAVSNATDNFNDPNNNTTSSGFDFGVGASYSFSRQVAGRIEYQRFSDIGKKPDFNSPDTPSLKAAASVATIGLVYTY